MEEEDDLLTQIMHDGDDDLVYDERNTPREKGVAEALAADGGGEAAEAQSEAGTEKDTGCTKALNSETEGRESDLSVPERTQGGTSPVSYACDPHDKETYGPQGMSGNACALSCPIPHQSINGPLNIVRVVESRLRRPRTRMRTSVHVLEDEAIPDALKLSCTFHPCRNAQDILVHLSHY